MGIYLRNFDSMHTQILFFSALDKIVTITEPANSKNLNLKEIKALNVGLPCNFF